MSKSNLIESIVLNLLSQRNEMIKEINALEPHINNYEGKIIAIEKSISNIDSQLSKYTK